MIEYWTVAEVAQHLGVGADAARGQLSRWGIKGAVRYPADDVRTAHAQRPGRGARTDIKEYAVTVKTTTLIDADAAFTEALGEIPRTYAWAAGRLGKKVPEALQRLMDGMRNVQDAHWGLRWDEVETVADLEWERRGTLTIWSGDYARITEPRKSYPLPRHFQVRICVGEGEWAPAAWYSEGHGTAMVGEVIYTGKAVGSMIASLLPTVIAGEFVRESLGANSRTRRYGSDIPDQRTVAEAWESWQTSS